MEPVCECGSQEGQLHQDGCRFELCPFCEVTLNEGCVCAYELLGLRRRDNPPESNWMPKKVYQGGLTPSQERRWQAILTRKGRLPFVSSPLMCGRCGKLWPDFFMVQDYVWEYYCGPVLRDAIVCEPCFHKVRRSIDKHQTRPEWLPTEEDILRYIEAWKSGDRETLRRLEPAKFKPGYMGVTSPSMRRRARRRSGTPEL